MKFIIFLLACVLSFGTMQAQLLNKEVFSLLNLDYPGLEKVKKAYYEDKFKEASQELLKYYRQRTGVVNPFLDLENITISPTQQKWADDALQHTFFVHNGYQPSYNYGKDINWQYWPVRDNELRWQLHRHKWFTPMGKAYWLTKDEKYAKEWTYQFLDWIKKNPLQQIDPVLYEIYDVDGVKGLAENVRFAWRPLEASGRLQDQINQFMLFLHSQAFTPEFLTDFLVNYSKHAHHTIANYSQQGNHLLFEAQYVLCAGIFFPEFIEAPNWRKSGIGILNREIKKQIYDDGGQYELDLGYHGGCISIFSNALNMARQNGYGNEFPESFVNTIKKMMLFAMHTYFPDYTFPCFSDARRAEPFSLVRNFRHWSMLFPEDEQLRYFATQGKEGKEPSQLCHASKTSGFFTFRNSWKQDATVMILKAGPEGEWHCQPDNGTFELWFNGKNLFPDSGSFIYGGDEEVWKQRNWFRQTAVHNTLTLDNKNIETTQSVTKLWKTLPNAQVFVTENPSYKELTHRRSVFFVDNSYFVIVDEAIGNATGNVNLHYQLCDGKVDLDKAKGQLSTRYPGSSNVLLRCFGPDKMQMVEEEGWYSIAYRQRTQRPAIAFNVEKTTGETVRYVTVIYPQKQVKKSTKISASIKNATDDKLEVEVSVNGRKQTLGYEF